MRAGAFAGGYRLDADDPAEASAAGEPLWELALAARHYHPHIATAAQSIAAIPPDCTPRPQNLAIHHHPYVLIMIMDLEGSINLYFPACQ